ncbi:unnamed protein product, partial [marine sediment metagenome]
AADFETQLANVSTMLDESAMRILPEYRKGLQALSVEFGESTQTLSKGLYDILSASIPPAEALGVLEVSAKAAAAGITDTGVAADAITTILNSYGMSADQAGMVSDKLFAIVKEGKTTFAELAPSIGKVAATASMAGLSFDDLGATRGGNEFNLNRVTRNIEIDGLKGAVKGLKRITEVNPQITANLIELTVENLVLAIAGAKATVTPTTDVLAEYLGVGTAAVDDFDCNHLTVVPLSEKVYIDEVLVSKVLVGDSLFIGANAAQNKGFDSTIGDWAAGTGGTFVSADGGVV